MRITRRSRGAVIPTAVARSRTSRSSAVTPEHNNSNSNRGAGGVLGAAGGWGVQAPTSAPSPHVAPAALAPGDSGDGRGGGGAVGGEGSSGGRSTGGDVGESGQKRPGSALEDGGSAADVENEPPLQARRFGNGGN